MFDAILHKLLSVISCRFIQSYNMCNSKLFEYLYVILWTLPNSQFETLIRFPLDWPLKCNELSRNDPVQLSVLMLLIKLVLS